MRLIASVVSAILVASCSQSGAPQASAPASSTSRALKPSPEYKAGSATVRLVVDDEGCVLEHRGGEAEVRRLPLSLRSPCYLLTWRHLRLRGGHPPNQTDSQSAPSVTQWLGSTRALAEW